MALDLPEAPQVGRQLQPAGRVVRLAPGQQRAQVVELCGEQGITRGLLRPGQLCGQALALAHVPVEHLLLHRIHLPQLFKLRQAELTDRLQHAKPRRAQGVVRGRPHQHHRRTQQPSQDVRQLLGAEPQAIAGGDRALDGPPPQVDRQAHEHRLLDLTEQAEAPIDRSGHGLVVAQPAAGTHVQQAEAAVQPRRHVGQGARAHLRRHQLQRQRQAIQAAADLRQAGRVVRRQREPGAVLADALDQQLHRGHLAQLIGLRIGRAGHVQRRHAPHHLARDAQRLAAGVQQLQLRQRPQQPRGQIGATFHQVLAVVQHQQGVEAVKALVQSLQWRHAAVDAPHGIGQRLGQQGGVAQRIQGHPPDATGVLPANRFGQRQRQPCLACTACAHQCQATGRWQQGPRLRHRRGSTQQRCRRRGQPAPGAGRRHPGARWLGRRRIACSLLDQRRREAVAATRHRGDDLVAERLAQGADLHRQVALFHHQARPDQGQQFAFANDAIAAFDQGQQQVEGASAQGQALALQVDTALRWPDQDRAHHELTMHAKV